mmetsp:Transcript_44254/g.95307  ORF Transcript_44254/g.95307 Transcript_44254/m.95307 type:complete len:484 (-) Transcript_44254:123-1574(-)
MTGGRYPGVDWRDTVERHPPSYKMAPKELRSDRSLALKLVAEDGQQLQYMAGGLMSDFEVVLAAVKQAGSALRLADPVMQNNKDICLAAVANDGTAYQYCSRDLREDHEIIMAALKSSGRVLSLLHSSLRREPEYVMAAVQTSGSALQYADPTLSMNRDIVRTAAATYPQALTYAHMELKNDEKFVLELVEKKGTALQYASTRLQNSRPFVLQAVERNVWALGSAAMELRSDRAFILECMKRNSMALQFAAIEVKSDRRFHAQILEVINAPHMRSHLKQMRQIARQVKKNNTFFDDANYSNYTSECDASPKAMNSAPKHLKKLAATDGGGGAGGGGFPAKRAALFGSRVEHNILRKEMPENELSLSPFMKPQRPKLQQQQSRGLFPPSPTHSSVGILGPAGRIYSKNATSADRQAQTSKNHPASVAANKDDNGGNRPQSAAQLLGGKRDGQPVGPTDSCLRRPQSQGSLRLGQRKAWVNEGVA